MRVSELRGDWYDHPSWYDILHSAGTAAEVDGLERIERRFTPAHARSNGRRFWLEPACGTGRYLRVAAGRGVRGIGIDRSPVMIDYARSHSRGGIRARFVVGDITRLRVARPVTFAFCPINTLRHLMTDEAMLRHLRCIGRALAPGGVYAVGIETTGASGGFPSEDIWKGRRGRCMVRQIVQYLPPGRAGGAPARSRRERVISHLMVQTPRRRIHLDSVYDLRTYSFPQWRGLIRRSAMRIVGMCDGEGGDAKTGPTGEPIGGYALYILAPRKHGITHSRGVLGR